MEEKKPKKLFSSLKISKRHNAGITLTALFVTIVILLILAGVTISIVSNTGLLKTTEDAVKGYQFSEEKDVISIAFANVFSKSTLKDKPITPEDLKEELKKNGKDADVWLDDNDDNILHIEFKESGNEHTIDIDTGIINPDIDGTERPDPSEDKTAPNITLANNSNTSWSQTGSVKVTILDNGGLAGGASIKYGWSTSNTIVPNNLTTANLNYTAGDKSTNFTVTASGLTGKYYLWIIPESLEDQNGNKQTNNKISSGTFYFDNTRPVVTSVTATTSQIIFSSTDETGITGYAVTTTNTAPDLGQTGGTEGNNGLGKWISCSSTPEITNKTLKGYTQGTTYYVWTRDAAGNVSNGKSAGTGSITTPSEADFDYTITWSNTEPKATVEFTTSSGFTIKTSVDGGKTWTNNNPVTVESGTQIYIKYTDGSSEGDQYAAVKPILTYTVTYAANTATSGNTANSSHQYNVAQTLTPNGYRKDGYNFIGWNTKADGTGTSYTDRQNVTNLARVNGTTVTLYAQWSKIPASSYVFAVGTTKGITTTGTPAGSYEAGTEITLTATAQAGYTFTGWTSSNPALVGNQTDASINFNMPTGNITMTPSAKLNEYHITYDLAEGTLESGKTNPTTYTVETDAITLNNPVREGYIFTGWTGSNGTTPQKTVTIAKGSTGDKNYTANWTKDTTSIDTENTEVTLDGVDGSTEAKTYEYDGTAQEPEVAVKVGGKTLTEGIDYEVSYENNTNAGTATVIITGKGKYTGTKTIPFIINQRALTVKAKSATRKYNEGNPNFEYTYENNVEGQTPKFTGTLSCEATENSGVGDYDITQGSLGLVDNGTFLANNYKISYVSAKLTITGKGLNGVNVKLDQETYEYDGTPKTPKPVIKDGDKVLEEGKDYELIYRDNIEPGEATIVVVGKGNYEGTLDIKFTITEKIPTSSLDVTLNATTGITSYEYDGTEKRPEVTVKDGETTLTQGVDYEISYKANTNAGEASVIVTGKGSYEGDKTIPFTINKRTLTVKAKAVTRVYNEENPNFEYTYENNVEGQTPKFSGALACAATKNSAVGEYDITQGNLAVVDNGAFLARNYNISYVSAKLTITIKSIAPDPENPDEQNGFTITLNPTTFEYDGTEKRPEVTVKDGETTLTKDTDYTVAYSNNINVGTGKVTVTGTGNYAGEKEATFTITAKSMTPDPENPDAPNGFTITLNPTTYVYDGTEKCPEVTVKHGETTLTEDDYSIAYKDNINVGTATVTVTGKNNYAGSKDAHFTITAQQLPPEVNPNPDDPTGLHVTLDPDYSYQYDGSPKTPAVTVTYEGKTLNNPKDYTVEYTNNTNAGTATVTIIGKDNYGGTITQTFVITPKPLSELEEPTLTGGPYEYDGKEKKPQVTIKDGNKTLEEGKDYTVIYKNNVEAGTAIVAIAGTGNYTGSVNKTFTITAKTLPSKPSTDPDDPNGLHITLTPETYVYDGTAKTPAVTVTYEGKTLTNPTNYTVAYSNNTNAGTATVTITGKDNYQGTATKNFTIDKADMIITKTDYSGTYDGDAHTFELRTTPSENVEIYYSETTALTAQNYTTAGKTNKPSRTEQGTTTVYYYVHYTGTDNNYNDYASDAKHNNATITIGEKSSDNLDVKFDGGVEGALNEMSFVYDGTAKTPTPIVKDGNTTLTAGTHYDVTYANNKNAGTATMTITAKGSYSGTVVKNFTIAKRAITVKSDDASKEYDGTPLTKSTGSVDTTGGKLGLAQGHSLSIVTTGTITNVGNTQNTINSVTITSSADGNVTANYTITKVAGTLTITAKSIETDPENPDDPNGFKVTLNPTSYTYDGTAKTPSVTVKTGNVTLRKDTDYTVEYRDNINVGTGKVMVTGAGNYAGTKTVTFTITRKSVDASTFTILVNPTSYTYDGTAKTPEVTVNDGGTTLVRGTDYDVAYENNINVGTAIVKVTGKGNYAGTKTANFTITAKTIEPEPGKPDEFTVTVNPTTYIYDGTPKTPSVVVKNGGTTLALNTDYTVAYRDNINVGTGKVIVTGKGNYAGEKEATFEITTKSITPDPENPDAPNGFTITLNPTTYVYDGTEKKPNVTVKDGSTILTEGADYTVAYRDNINVGTGKVIVTGKGNYAGEKEATFEITVNETNTLTVEFETTPNYTYDGTAKTPGVTVKNGEKILTKGVDYEVTYRNNINAGTATVVVTGKGNYAGEITKIFTIAKKAVSTTTVTLNQTNYTYDGVAKTPTPTVKDGSKTLTVGTEYTVRYANNTNAGTASCIIEGTGNYTGTKTVTFTITAKSMEGSTGNTFTVTVNPETYVYNGTEREPAVTVKDGSKTLTAGTNYTVAYSNNINAGTAKVTVTGKGNYSGKKEQTFTISKANVSVSKSDYKGTYDGASHTFSLTTTPSSNVTIYYSTTTALTASNYTTSGSTTKPSRTEQGTTTVYYYIHDTSGNYNDYASNANSNNAKITIDAKSSSNLVVTLGTSSYTYDGTAKTPSVTVKEGSTTLTEGTHYTVGYSNNINAGTATVTVTLKGNYSGTVSENFVINKRAVTVKSADASKDYDGTALRAQTGGTVTSGSLVAGHELTVTSTGSRTDAGSGSNTISTVTIKSGTTDVTPNYEITKTSGTLTVNARRITVKSGSSSKTYDGSPLTNNTGTVTSGSLVSGHTMTVTNTGTITNYQAGGTPNTLSTVTIKSGTTNVTGNYAITKTNGTLTINRRTLTVTATAKSKTYGAANPNLTYTYSGQVSGQTPGFTGALTCVATTASAPGTYAITQGNLALANNSPFLVSNYNMSFTGANLTVNAKVTYNANGGTGGPVSQVKIYGTNNPLTLSNEVPARTGYTFGGWATSSSSTTASYQPGGTYSKDENLNLYAVWTANTYTVSYNGNGNTGGSTTSSSHTYGVAKNLTANGYTRAYTVTYNHNYTGSSNTSKIATYTFNKWNTKADGTGTNYENSASVRDLATSGTVNLYAQWNSGSVTYGPTRAGYTFGGWYTTSACTGTRVDNNGTYTPTAGITLYAKWTANTYTVSYNGNGNTGGSTTSSSHTYGVAKNLTANGYTRAYTVTYNHNYTGSSNTSKIATYTFNKWNTKADGTGTNYENSASVRDLATSGTVNLYAQWNSGSVTYGPTRAGYTFGGWYTTSACTGTRVDNNGTYTPTAGITLYAKWTVNNYVVTYNRTENGGQANSNTTASVTYGSAIDLSPTAVKSNWTFVGWNTNKDAQKAITSAELGTMPNRNITLYAIYSKTLVGTFKYYNNASTLVSKTIYNKETTATITAPAAQGVTTGYTFRHWSTSEVANASSTVGAGGSITLSTDTTYYGSYYYTVTGTYYYYNGSTYTNIQKTATAYMNYKGAKVGGTPTAPTVTTPTGWTARGWSTNTSASANVATPGAITTNTTYYYSWQKTTTATFHYYNGSAYTTTTNSPTAYKNYQGTETGGTPTAPSVTNPAGWTADGWVKNSPSTSASTVSIANERITSTAVYYYRWRKTVTVSYNANGGTGTAPAASTGTAYNIANVQSSTNKNTITKAGITLRANTFTKTGYNFSGWDLGAANSQIQLENNATANAQWTAGTVSFEVRHYLMDVDGRYPTNPTIEKITNVKADATITLLNYKKTTSDYVTGIRSVTAKYTKTGTTTETVATTTTNAADGSTVVYIYYERQQYTLTLKAETGIASVSGGGTYYYGKSATIRASVSKNYTFENWTGSLDSTSNPASITVTGNMTITANALPKVYTINLNAPDATTAGTTKVYEKYGKNISIDTSFTKELYDVGVTTPQRTGYTFEGYYTAASGGTQMIDKNGLATNNFASTYFNDDNTTNLNGDLYAHWTVNSYTITFNANGGSVTPTSKTQNYGTAVTMPTPTRTGYTFSGWSKTYTTMPAENVTVTAQWTPHTYTMTYNANGGTGAPASQTITYGQNATISSTRPTKAGYTFEGWSTSSTATTGTYQPGGTYSNVTGAVTLYAIWSKELSATFNSYGQGLSGAQVEHVKIYNNATSGNITTPKALPASGYSFRTWSTKTEANATENQIGENKIVAISENKVYYASYQKTATITYNANGGSGAPSAQSGTTYMNYEGSTIPASIKLSTTRPTRAGYTFAGWKIGNKTYAAGDTVSIEDSISAVAQWNYATYTVYFDANGGTVNTTSKTVTYNSTYGTLPTPTWTGHTFIGWRTSKTATTNITSATTVTTTTNHTLYAIWQIHTYTVSYNANGGTGEPGSQTKTYGQSLTLSTTKPIRDKYSFIGWGTSSTSKTLAYVPGGSYTANSAITLYAIWVPAPVNPSGSTTDSSGSTTTGGNTPNLSYTTTWSGTLATVFLTTTSGWEIVCSVNGGGEWRTYSDSGWRVESGTTIYVKYYNSYTTYYTTITIADTTAPTITLSSNTNTSWSKSHSVTVTITDNESGVNIQRASTAGYGIKYGWSTSTTSAPTYTYTEVALGQLTTSSDGRTATFTVNTSGLTGKHYLWILPNNAVLDKVGNSYNTTVKSGVFYTDNTGPSNPAIVLSATTTSFDYRVSATDANSGIQKYVISYQKPSSTGGTASTWYAKTITTTQTATSGNLTSVTNGGIMKAYVTVTDNVGNTSTSSTISMENAKYTISYSANGGSGAPGSQLKFHGVSVTLSSSKPTRSGYTFQGWGTSTSSTTASYQAGSTYTGNANTTLYAVWRKNNTVPTLTYSVTYDGGRFWQVSLYADGYDIKTSEDDITNWINYDPLQGYMEVVAGNKITLYVQVTTASGPYYYSILLDYTGDTIMNGMSGSTSAMTTYTVSYNANGGTGAPASQTKLSGLNLTLSSTIPTRSGYEFKGWGTTSSSTTATYQPGATYSTNANRILYAIWTTPTLTYSSSQWMTGMCKVFINDYNKFNGTIYTSLNGSTWNSYSGSNGVIVDIGKTLYIKATFGGKTYYYSISSTSYSGSGTITGTTTPPASTSGS